MYKPTVDYIFMGNNLERYIEFELFLNKVIGYSLEELKDLLAKGYTLTPPSYKSLMEDFEV